MALAALAVLALCLPLALPVAQAENLKHKRHAVRTHIRHAQGDLDEASHALAAAQSKLSAAKSRLAVAQRRLDTANATLHTAQARDAVMQARLETAEQQLADAQDALAAARKAVKDQRREIGILVAQNYQYGDPQLMGLVAMLNAAHPTDVTSQMNSVHSMMSRQASTLDTLRATEDDLAEKEAKVADAKQAVAEQRQAAAAHLAQTQKLQAAALAVHKQVASYVAERRVAARAAIRIKRADMARLTRLKRQERRIIARILARARHDHGGYRGSTNGLLYRPVPGYITSPYGWRIHPIYGYWGLHDGDDFHAPCGTHEHAAGSGRVIAEYYSSVWGNRLFLDLGRINGKNVTVVYNHLERYRVGTGQHVSRGQTIGWAGTTGWSTACHLHFTVLVNGRAVNPAPWL